MTLPPNVKEEIEKAILKLLGENVVYAKGDLHTPLMAFATKFYLKALGDRDAIAKAAFEAGKELVIYPPTRGYIPKYSEPDDYLASDEYKKLVGE